ncbi:MAG: SAM-dependent methyltransferase, partial [Bacteriovoracaceae bacterium]
MELQISLLDKIKVVAGIYSKVHLVNGFKSRILTFLNPLDAVRYFEIPNLWKFIKKENLHKMKVLDVSSPHQMSMLLHGTDNDLLRINTDPKEEFLIDHRDNLRFKFEDATALTLSDNEFDLVYSISVIEHIHAKYLLAIKEMVRVLKPGGHLYLSFPLDAEYSEVWLDYEDYPGQFTKDGKYFFQYNFNKETIVKEILS